MKGKPKKSVSLSARLPHELVEQADRIAKEKGVSRSELIEKGLSLLVGRELVSLDERVELATEAMRNGRPVPLRIDWDRIEQKIGRTKPRFRTLDEAMAKVRKRK